MSQSHSQRYPSDDGISVVALESAPDSSAIFGGVLGAYQQQAYDRGYRRAVADVLASLLALTEGYLRELPDHDAAIRRTLHGFEAYVERHFSIRDGAEFVSGGLGI